MDSGYQQIEQLYKQEIEAYKRHIEELKSENRANVDKNAVLLDKIRGLTDVLNKTHATNEDLNKAFEHVHRENLRLKSQSNNLELAPLSMPQESNDMALEKVQSQCIELAGESITWISQKDKMVQRMKFLERECERYQRDNTTLGKQVRHLVRTLEEERGMIIRRAEQVNEYSSNNQVKTASDVIDQHLITFESIEELQQQNQKLLSLVKDMSKREEERELHVESEENKRLISEIETFKAELEKVKDDREKIMNAFNVIHKERDLFKILLGKTRQVEHLTPEVFQRMVSIACTSGPVMGLEAPKDNQDKDAHIADLKAMISKLEQEISGLRDEFETSKRRNEDEIRLKTEMLEEAHISLVNERQKIDSLQQRYDVVEENSKSLMNQYDDTRTQLQKITFEMKQMEKEKQMVEESLKREKQMIEDSFKRERQLVEARSQQERHILEEALREEKERKHAELLNLMKLKDELNESRNQCQLLALQLDNNRLNVALEQEKHRAELEGCHAQTLEFIRLRNLEREARLKAQTKQFKTAIRAATRPKPFPNQSLIPRNKTKLPEFRLEAHKPKTPKLESVNTMPETTSRMQEDAPRMQEDISKVQETSNTPRLVEERPRLQEERVRLVEERPRLPEERLRLQEERPKIQEERPRVLQEERPKIQEDVIKAQEEPTKVQEDTTRTLPRNEPPTGGGIVLKRRRMYNN